ncbi:hypothetical protein L0Y49_02630 [bacterium]|nr:hypothetical protein [bacterium]MCI0566240.1 hypothetical protein [bacterium]MCI0680196.1 hypothetical protein [bacterium]
MPLYEDENENGAKLPWKPAVAGFSALIGLWFLIFADSPIHVQAGFAYLFGIPLAVLLIGLWPKVRAPLNDAGAFVDDNRRYMINILSTIIIFVVVIIVLMTLTFTRAHFEGYSFGSPRDIQEMGFPTGTY